MTNFKPTLGAERGLGFKQYHSKRFRIFSRVAPKLRFVALLLLLPASGIAAPQQQTPLLALHAHNDYEHPRPLLDALDHHFCSIEADIYLVDGKLLVAHERKQVTPERTLESLYLEPLRDRVLKGRG